jgi:flagellar motility protein MotE (MotC chaperone)
MKNILVIALVSAVLFSVSAALSVWLQSSKTAAASTDEKDKKKADDHKAGDDHKTADAHGDKPKADSHGEKPKADTHAADDKEHKSADPKLPQTGPKDSTERVDLRRTQIEVVLRDLRAQREQYDKLSKQVVSEVKAALVQADASVADAAKAAEQKKTDAAKAVDPKVAADIQADEKAKLTKIAALFDQIPPEKAAEILQNLADNGNMDTAVKILAGAKERSAAKVLAYITDPGLSADFIERMRTAKRPLAPPNER